ncbi:MAG: diguanylate cyclase [Halomonadaceae bacterium]|nr:diguanylate cyclase [Halomonadaceae bacterium]
MPNGNTPPRKVTRAFAHHPARLAQRAFEQSLSGMAITDAQRRIVQANTAFCRCVGNSNAETLGRPISDFFVSLNSPGPLSSQPQDGMTEASSRQHDVLCRQHNGELIPMLMTIDALNDEQGVAHHFLYSFMRLGTPEEEPLRERHWLHLDPVTGLPNWLLLRDRLDHALAQAERTEATLALLYIDIDRFKVVNETAGHIEGDRILAEVARRLQREVRNRDTLARLGSDQFVVLLEKDGSAEAAQAVSERLHEALEPAFITNERHLLLTASIGVALYPSDAEDAETLIAAARSAMLHARKKGPGRLAFVNRRLTAQLKEKHRFETMLSEAVHMPEKHFELRYQPVFKRIDHSVSGLEAVLYWQHPQRWQQAPAHYLDDIARLGLAVRLNRWLIQTAIAHHQQWNQRNSLLGRLSVSIQLCEAHLTQEVFDQRPLDRFLTHQSTTLFEWLTLKVPATGLNNNLDAALLMFKRLEQLGIHLAVDGLGSNPVDLAWLTRLPFRQATLDARLTRQRGEGQRLLSTACRLLEALDIEPVLVNVDDATIAAQVETVPARHMRGDLYCPAMSAPALAQWLNEPRLDE